VDPKRSERPRGGRDDLLGMRALTIIALLLGTGAALLHAADGAQAARAAVDSASADQQADIIRAAGTDPHRLAAALWRPLPGSPALDAALNRAVIVAGQVPDRTWRTLLLDLASDDLLKDDGVADPQALAVLGADPGHEGDIALLTARHPRAYAALLTSQCASRYHGVAWLAATEVALGEQAAFLAPALLPQCRLWLVIHVTDPGDYDTGGAWGRSFSADGRRDLPTGAPGDVLYLLQTSAEAGAIVVATIPQLLVVQRLVVTGSGAGFGASGTPIDDQELIWQELHRLVWLYQPNPARQDVPMVWTAADAYVLDITRLRQRVDEHWQLLRNMLIDRQLLDPHLVVPLPLRISVVDRRQRLHGPLPTIAGVEAATAAAVGR